MATLIGESTFSGTNGSHFRARIYLDSYTQSTENNSTTAVRHLYMQSFDGYSGYGATIAGYIDGVQTGSTSSIGKNSVVDMGTSTITVTHNNEGVGSVSFNSSINASAWGLGTANIYASWTPPSIARSAKITAPSNAAIEETIKLNINRLVDTYNYTLRYKFTGDTQDYEGTIVENINQDSYDWTIPEEFYQYWKEHMPTKIARYCYVYCDTYSGTTLIGTTEAVMQILTLSKTTPTFETYNFADQKAATRALTGDPTIMVAGYSVGRLEFTCQLDYYSKVYQVQNILTQEDIQYTVVSNTDKTQVIKVEMFITDFNTFYPIWVFDGRCRAARIIVRTPEQQKPINYTYITYTRIDYIPLTANITWLKRPSATTGEVTIGFSGNYWNGNFGKVDNELSLGWKYRIKGATDWTTGGTFTKDTDYTITNNTYESKGNISLGTVFDYRNVYEVGLFYADKLVDTFTSKIVPKGFPIFWWNKDGVYDGNNKKFLVEGEGGDTLPIGAMLPYGNTTPPENWLICDGSEVSRTTYAELFNVIGTSYGSGDGTTTFNLPDKRGRVSVGRNSSDTSFDVLGERGGAKTVTLTVDQMPKHTHNILDEFGQGLVAMRAGNGAGDGWDVYVGNSSTNWKYRRVSAINGLSETGGSEAHDNLQPYEVDCWIIKASKTTSTPITSEVTNTYSESESNVYACNYINNLSSPKYLLAKISTDGYISHTGYSDFVLTEIENNTGNKLTIENNKIVIKQGVNNVRVSGTVFCEGLENTAYMWGILYKGNTVFTNVINSGSYYQSVVFPDRIISVTTNDTIYGILQASGTSNVSVRAGEATAWLLVEIIN